ncbi:TPA: hypothetical protein PXM19_001802 [Yersinia enterocolitica]|nr:hypothetical protein [Yersinia enterocolitica]HDL6954873.1 hypothetical protein [Yersinia enterocolitica]HDL6960481.1 hypothetical protein [Yersinia enterocolitica]HDL6966426.1 hypothetical protein [Yersinia enterocolitica]HDL7094854.1 hypothetical protein [Yersinia enterocolitica]
MYHQIAKHRRPVYRHKYGDFAIDRTSLRGFIGTYLEGNEASAERRIKRYQSILDWKEMEKTPRGYFINWGTIATLKPRGIQWINACLNRFGEMIQDMGPEAVASELGENMQW